jgi:UDP-N-acetylmuramyl pentapeptide phosphotransferase/UDP-N-acetylglucosamine-1-phosphate transferase
LPPNPTDFLGASLAFVIPFLIVVALLRPFMGFLAKRGMMVEDVHKLSARKVPSPAGPLLFSALLAGEAIAFVIYRTTLPLVVAAVILIAGLLGLLDDLYVLGGKTKPLLLVIAGVPVLMGELLDSTVYTSRLYFPLFGATGEHFTIYSILVFASMPIVANAFNMMDAFNGEISGFTSLASLALIFGIGLRVFTSQSYSAARLAVAVPLAAVSLGFYLFNRYPSRVFDGDSGALAFGAMYAVLAVTGGVEFAAVIAIVPAILNSFYILSSVRGFVERRKMNARPTHLGDDGLLHASTDPSAPSTLVRMLLFDGPLPEKSLVREILLLTAFACVLSAATSVLTWVI